MNVFLYGTLRRGQYNSGLVYLQGGAYLGLAALKGAEMFSLNGGLCPGVVLTDDKSKVVYGELVSIDGNVLSTLDQLEGHPLFYKRELLTVESGEAWVYVFQHKVHPEDKIMSGDWLNRH